MNAYSVFTHGLMIDIHCRSTDGGDIEEVRMFIKVYLYFIFLVHPLHHDSPPQSQIL